ncbi:acyl carrier protein [Robertmurraya siralis]|uniref:acyl carrier protein n=1 Tax=Robertmurraya siralis TaxID=77777 RepID=UPI000BA71471|nr:phosphopantetheine-binding protein [Robertmurraya siralis]PAE18285.1 hypothetical protein CHH80_22475 [Bacillus sp. 7504-2]
MSVEIKIKELITKIAKQSKPDEISKETFLKEDLLIDSINIISLMIELEEYFNIVIEDHEITEEHFKTVGSLYHLIESKISREAK